MQAAVARMGVRGLKIHAEWLKRGDERKRYYQTCFMVIAAKTCGTMALKEIVLNQ